MMYVRSVNGGHPSCPETAHTSFFLNGGVFMTLPEASRRFHIDEEKLLYYEENGLFDCHKQPDGGIDYCEETLEYVGLIDLLLKAGLDMETLKTYLASLGDDSVSNEAQIKILMKQRYALLDDIHGKEKVLHQLDYVIHESKKKA